MIFTITFNKSPGPPVPCTVGVLCVASGPVSGDCSCLLSSDVWQQRASAAAPEDTTAILRQWGSLHSPARRGGYCPRYKKGQTTMIFFRLFPMPRWQTVALGTKLKSISQIEMNFTLLYKDRDKGHFWCLFFRGSQIFQLIISRLSAPAAYCLDSALHCG